MKFQRGHYDDDHDPVTMAEQEAMRGEIERLTRELDQASSEKVQSAQYGLVLLEEKSHLKNRCEDLETLYENTRHELDITLEVCGLWLIARSLNVGDLQSGSSCVVVYAKQFRLGWGIVLLLCIIATVVSQLEITTLPLAVMSSPKGISCISNSPFHHTTTH